MQIEFQEKPVGCLQEQAVEVLYQEETAELIVPDVYPDVQDVVDVSAVCCVRDQEILSGSMTASGAFQAVILFTAEGTGEVCVQEAYLPFFAKLNREEIQADSRGCTEVRIRSADARILNSRKILIRVSYAVRLSVYGPCEITAGTASCTEDVQLLRTEAEMTVPVAVGEKVSTFSEPIELPALSGPVRRIAKTVPVLQMLEQRLTDGKAVWRGILQLHLLCLLESGELSGTELQIPVSQYVELGQEFEDGSVRMQVSLTEFQVEADTQGSYLVTVGMRLQAVLWQKKHLELIEDGYCIGHRFQAEYDSIRLRQLLDEPTAAAAVEVALRGHVQKTVDCTAWVDFPVCKRSIDEIAITSVVTMHALYYDEKGKLCGETVRGEDSVRFALCDGAVCYADTDAADSCSLSTGSDCSTLGCKITVGARCFGERTVLAMREATVGEEDPDWKERPSLIVCRTAGTERLWDLAKRSGSTVRAIQEANGLDAGEVQEQALLLIPVI